MNFFEHQEQARKYTWRLLALFAGALVCLIVLAALLFVGIAYVLGFHTYRLDSYETGIPVWELALKVFEWQHLLSVAAVVLMVVILASLYKMMQLRGGGHAIAAQLGGKMINANPRNAAEKKLLNVVEEMAIASGIPVPPVYVLDEPGINAFAAGYKPVDAVIGVTQGAIDQLTRNELQGVIAHEFSHIFNGDMRLNLRLVSLIFGIMVLALSGRYLLEGGRLSRKNRGATIGIGLALMALGYLGVFFGNLIKSAISRQREFLADASAIQFTRDNLGIADALKKIGGHTYHSQLTQHDANEVSHMLFAQGLNFQFLSGLMATHPPLPQRIKRVEPNWDGQYIQLESCVPTESVQHQQLNVAGVSQLAATGVADVIHHAGEITESNIAVAVAELSLLEQQYQLLHQHIHEPYTARAVVYSLLLHEASAVEPGVIDKQWQDLRRHQPVDLIQKIESIAKQLRVLPASQIMILLDIALPIVGLLSDKQYVEFKAQMLRLIKVDGVIDIREWAIFYLVDYYCRPKDIQANQPLSLKQRKPAIGQLLSALATIDGQNKGREQQAFEVASQSIGFPLRFYQKDELSIATLNQALKEIRKLKPLQKPLFLKACVKLIEHDGEVAIGELMILTCLARAMDCPFPVLSVAH